VQRLQAFKYELKPTGEQQRDICRYAGSCRVVYNEALVLQVARYERCEKKVGYAGLCKELTAWRNGSPLPSGRVASWLAESPVHPLQQALKDLERPYANFFSKRAAFPRRKKKGQHDRFCYPDPKQIKLDQANSRIFLPRLRWLHYRNSRDVRGEVRNATVSLSGGKWYVSIQTAREVIEPVPRATTISNNHAMVSIEDLRVRNMSRSAAGSVETPGKNVKAKSGLNKCILDQGWFEFRRQLEYKLAWNGGWLIAVPPQNTSRTCPACGRVSADNRGTQAKFACVACGYEAHAYKDFPFFASWV
jgi:transposase